MRTFRAHSPCRPPLLSSRRRCDYATVYRSVFPAASHSAAMRSFVHGAAFLPSSCQIRESVGLSTRTSDADLIAASARAAELQRDVVVLRKVLATAGRTQLKDAAGEAAG